MSESLLMIPLLWQMAYALLLIFCWQIPQYHRIVSIFGNAIGVGLSALLFVWVKDKGIQVLNAGGWAAPYGISFVADAFSAILVLLTSIAGLAVSIASTNTLLDRRIHFGYFPVFHFLLAGLIGAFIAGDLFNLYVWFEIMIISSFVLLSLGGLKAQLEGGVKYFTLNMLASVIFLTAVAVIYGLTGTLNMADLSIKMAAVDNKILVRIAGIIFLVGFGIKSAVFPLYSWLPASYHTPPAPVSAIFGGLLTKVGVYAMARVFLLIFPEDPFLNNLFISIAILTIVAGGLGAMMQQNIQRLFSYLIVCHIGFMVIGLGLRTEAAIAGMVFYMIHDIIVKTNLFLVGGLVYQIEGHWERRHCGGLYDRYPWISFLMAIPLFSVVGIPPLSGFWPKISLVLAAFDVKQYWALGAILLGSFLTLYIIGVLWIEVFWKQRKNEPDQVDFLYYKNLLAKDKFSLVFPLVLLGAVSLYIGFGAESIQKLSQQIAKDLIHPETYIRAVLP